MTDQGLIGSHFGPCGAVVGVASTAYSAPCRFYRNGPVGRILYYEAAPGAKSLKGWNVFRPASQNLEWNNTSGIGEVTPQVRTYSKGACLFPGLDGSQPDGTAADFRGRGVSPVPGGYIRGQDLPECNFPRVGIFFGIGVLLSGESNWTHTAWNVNPLAVPGGVEIGGEGGWSHTPALSAGVGLVVGGAGSWSHTPALSTGVGLVVGGGADWSYTPALGTAGGGVEIGGGADWTYTPALSSGGGVILGGSGF